MFSAVVSQDLFCTPFFSHNLHSKGNVNVFRPKNSTPYWYLLQINICCHHFIKNTFYLSFMAVLDKAYLRPKMMTLTGIFGSMKFFFRFSPKKIRYLTYLDTQGKVPMYKRYIQEKSTTHSDFTLNCFKPY